MLKRILTGLVVGALSVGLISAPGVASERSTVFLWHWDFDSSLDECGTAYYGGPTLRDDYSRVSIDSTPTIENPSDVFSIRVSFSQSCYDPGGYKYLRKLSAIAPDGSVIPLSLDSTSKYESEYSIYCQIYTGGCWSHTDTYKVRMTPDTPAGVWGLRFDTTWTDTVCRTEGNASVCESFVPQSHSFDLQQFFTVIQTAPPKTADSGETVAGAFQVQRAGSQLFITSEIETGSFKVWENGVIVDSFVFDGTKQAHIVEKRITGEVELTKEVDGASVNLEFEDSKSLLWYQNVNLGAFNISSLSSAAKEKVKNLVNHMYLDSGTWTKRESKVTKFICTGIYREGASASEKLEARKKAKLACQSAQDLDRDSDSRVSFFYQTKPTQAASYVGKVLVTVKGIEPEIENRLDTP